MKKRALLSVCVVAFCFQSAFAVDAVFIPSDQTITSWGGGVLEAQGSTGRIDLPVAFQTLGIGGILDSYRVAGATSNGNIQYTLYSDSSSSDNSFLVTNSSATGPSAILLNANLSDIAYTNGQLYGISTIGNKTNIDTISPTGNVQTVLTQPNTSLYQMRLSGIANGSGLLALPATSLGNTSGYIVDPKTLQTSPITIAQTSQIYDTVINASGNAFSTIRSQKIFSYPSGTSQGSRSTATSYGSSLIYGVVSDEFAYDYSPSLPALAQTAWNATVSPQIGEIDGLTRTPQIVTISGPISITNYIAPDNTSVNNVITASSITQNFSGGAQAGPITISVQDSPAGALSERNIAQATVSLNLSSAHRGLYLLGSSSTMNGDYSYGNTVDSARTIQAGLGSKSYTIAYDPISNNLVGNGDAALGVAGWEDTGGLLTDTSHNSFILTPSSQPDSMRQTLQISTPNTAMLLSFTYFLQLFPSTNPDSIHVTLNGIDIGDVTASTSSVQTFQSLITNPALENLNNAVLTFAASTSGNQSWVDVGNLSLIAVPEPTSFALICLSAASVFRRKKRHRP